jgi:predicted metal-dependent TIM-barrel fold hydrolase
MEFNPMPGYIDPHIHMVSRTTDDYKRMALAGGVLVSEPAFWAGFDRSRPVGLGDRFHWPHKNLRQDQ